MVDFQRLGFDEIRMLQYQFRGSDAIKVRTSYVLIHWYWLLTIYVNQCSVILQCFVTNYSSCKIRASEVGLEVLCADLSISKYG